MCRAGVKYHHGLSNDVAYRRPRKGERKGSNDHCAATQPSWLSSKQQSGEELYEQATLLYSDGRQSLGSKLLYGNGSVARRLDEGCSSNRR
ncbi:hypothetical protein VCV18_006301 [Metarhizium anisopliae]